MALTNEDWLQDYEPLKDLSILAEMGRCQALPQNSSSDIHASINLILPNFLYFTLHWTNIFCVQILSYLWSCHIIFTQCIYLHIHVYLHPFFLSHTVTSQPSQQHYQKPSKEHFTHFTLYILVIKKTMYQYIMKFSLTKV